jgi:hypothetical protein
LVDLTTEKVRKSDQIQQEQDELQGKTKANLEVQE